MSKTIKIPGRIESVATGKVVTGANFILDDTKGKKQNVINEETDAELLRLDQEKQGNLTFDQTPTENSTNPVTSGGVYAADQMLSQAIEAILLLIPSAASELNKLVDVATMNSSISTATASFKGTYNLVSDLHLTVSATHAQIAAALDALSLGADNNDYAFVQVPNTDTAPTDIAKTERYKFNGENWAYEYDLNNSGFTTAQWNAINSGITTLLVAKLSALPTNEALTLALAGKQDNLTFDNAPTAGSNNPVKSGGIYTRNNEIVALINALDVAKQNVLTFDTTPTNGSTNPVTSNGVYLAIQLVQTAVVALDGRMGTAETKISTAEGNIVNLQAAYAALTQSDIVVVSGALPSSGQQQNIIYRQPDQDHTPPQFYSDYMWNGTAWLLMATYNNAIDQRPKKGSQNLVTSGGVFDNMGALDVSELNATENPHTLKPYATLDAALADIPSDYQKGGMSIKFIQGSVGSSDNKYFQYRLMSNTFNTTVTNWQGVDDEPTAGSDNFVKSGGVARNEFPLGIHFGNVILENIQPANGWIVPQSLTWANVDVDYRKHIVIPLNGAKNITVKGNADNSTYIGFLSSYSPVSGDASGIVGMVQLNAGEVQKLNVPSGQSYFYVQTKTSTDNQTPQGVILDDDIQSLQNGFAALDKKLTIEEVTELIKSADGQYLDNPTQYTGTSQGLMRNDGSVITGFANAKVTTLLGHTGDGGTIYFGKFNAWPADQYADVCVYDTNDTLLGSLHLVGECNIVVKSTYKVKLCVHASATIYYKSYTDLRSLQNFEHSVSYGSNLIQHEMMDKFSFRNTDYGLFLSKENYQTVCDAKVVDDVKFGKAIHVSVPAGNKIDVYFPAVNSGLKDLMTFGFWIKWISGTGKPTSFFVNVGGWISASTYKDFDSWRMLYAQNLDISEKIAGGATSAYMVLQINRASADDCEFEIASPFITQDAFIPKIRTSAYARDNVRYSDALGKLICWYGTSIPAGCNYPSGVASRLSASLDNLAIAKTHVHTIEPKTVGNYTGDWVAALKALSETVEEKQWIIDNYASIYPNLTDNPPSVSDVAGNVNGIADEIINSSFEKRIIAWHVDESNSEFKGAAEYIVFDHGYNDAVADSEYTELVKLNTHDGSPEYEALLAESRDRTKFYTAANYIFDKIFEINPMQKIIIVTHYTRTTLTAPLENRLLVSIQEELGKFWGFKCINIADKCGVSKQIITGSKSLWNREPYSTYSAGQDTTKDMTMLNILVPDRVHPFTDPNHILDKRIELAITKEMR